MLKLTELWWCEGPESRDRRTVSFVYYTPYTRWQSGWVDLQSKDEELRWEDAAPRGASRGDRDVGEGVIDQHPLLTVGQEVCNPKGQLEWKPQASSRSELWLSYSASPKDCLVGGGSSAHSGHVLNPLPSWAKARSSNMFFNLVRILQLGI